KTQEASLARVLDLLDELAGKRKMTLGLVLDEFQEIARFGEHAEWRLRAGARTRDIVRLARKGVDRAEDTPRIDGTAVDAAFREILEEDADSTQRWWS